MSSRTLCINCGICINRIARHNIDEQDIRVVSFIAETISPRVITEYDKICQACLDAVMTRVNQTVKEEISNIDSQPPESSHTQVVGHSKVCRMCGTSILRKRSVLVLRTDPTKLQQMIATTIMDFTVSQELTASDRVCHSCWSRARRTTQRRQAEEGTGTEIASVSLPLSFVVKTEEPYSAIEQSEILDPIHTICSQAEETGRDSVSYLSIPSSIVVKTEPPSSAVEQSEIADAIHTQEADEKEKVVFCVPQTSQSDWVPKVSSVVTQVKKKITLENYKRAPNTAAQCVFSFCTNQHLQRISDGLRIKIINDHNFYLPVHARVCVDHLLSNSWDTLYNAKSSTAVFTVEQIEHIFSLNSFNRNNSIDFNDPLNIDDHLFQYWLGLTKEKFRNLLMDAPQIQSIHRGVTGLVAYLIKLRNGDSDERIASLMGIPRRTVERLMENVREFANCSSIIKSLQCAIKKSRQSSNTI